MTNAMDLLGELGRVIFVMVPSLAGCTAAAVVVLGVPSGSAARARGLLGVTLLVVAALAHLGIGFGQTLLYAYIDDSSWMAANYQWFSALSFLASCTNAAGIIVLATALRLAINGRPPPPLP